jgi:protein-tyrosine phosphatase
LNDLGADDLNAINDLPVGTVVDLRHAPERQRQPSKWPPQPDRAMVLTQPTDTNRENAKVAPHEAFMVDALYSADDARGYMLNSYQTRPHDAGFKALFSDTLNRMTEEGETDTPGILVHCAAGKDRTGTLCALIQGLLGVSSDDIMADYMLTETAVDIEAILQPAAVMFKKRYGRAIDADALRPMFGVEPAYLEASLEAMGDMETYARDVLGLSADRLNLIRTRYLSH